MPGLSFNLPPRPHHTSPPAAASPSSSTPAATSTSTSTSTSRTSSSPASPRSSHVKKHHRPVLGLRSSSDISASSSSAMDSLRRHSLAAIGKNKDKENRKENRKASPGPAARSSASKAGLTLDIKVESSPAVFHGNINQSTGALYAGQMLLNVTDPEVTLSTFTMRVLAESTVRKPVSRDCPDCAKTTVELKQWPFIDKPQRYLKGMHTVPFSYLFPGHLPATTKGELGRIQYFLEAKAVFAPQQSTPPTTPQSPASPVVDAPLIFRHEVVISRAVKPLDEKNSIRIFPPTNLTARVTYEPIVHPIGEYNLQMVLNGITDRSQKDIQTRWRLRKMNWRLEEIEKVISPACPKHAGKVGGQGKGIEHTETRTVGRDEIKSGWKTDLSDASVSMDFSIRPSAAPRPLCDVDAPSGYVLSHSLVIELIIAEEWAPNKNPEKATPTGAARVLRMQFAMMITERAGMGISWDEEMPPMYEDVPASPPMYPRDVIREETPEIQRTQSQMVDYVGTPLGSPPPFRESPDGWFEGPSTEEFEGLNLGPSRFQGSGNGHSRPGSSGSGNGSSGGGATAATGSASASRPAANTRLPPLTSPIIPGSSQRQQITGSADTPTSARGRHRLDLDDFMNEEQDTLDREREERDRREREENERPDVDSGSLGS